ncbi:MAG: hypothetical protein KDA96_17495 [Planctomycetaceae bacterium]|nr:hypothetical protein [Planctomycetaceae bacterium]
MSTADAQSSDETEVPSGPLRVPEDCWMVGYRNPDALLQCNTYIRTFRQFGGARNVCIDPGSPFDFDVIQSNIQQVCGGMSEVHGMTINHQDPDVAGNSQRFCVGNPDIEMLVSQDVWRLLQHMQLTPGSLRLSSGRTTSITTQQPFQYVPTPFCHFRGAMALYDPEHRILYSGDLFGGLNRPGQVHLLATDEDWRGIAQFHQIYMPSREVLRYAVREIMNLRPRVEIIAPQHGHVITGDLVGAFLERMHELPVGLDLLSEEWDAENLGGYTRIIQALVDVASDEQGPMNILGRLKAQEFSDELQGLLEFTEGSVKVVREGYSALAKTFARLTNGESPDYIRILRDTVLDESDTCGLPVPPVVSALVEGGDV